MKLDLKLDLLVCVLDLIIQCNFYLTSWPKDFESHCSEFSQECIHYSIVYKRKTVK